MDTRLKHLQEVLYQTKTFAEAAAHFRQHIKSGFINDFLRSNLEDIAKGRFRSKNLIIGQLQINLLTVPDFQYKIRLLTQSDRVSKTIKWSNKAFIARIIGRGSLQIVRYKVPRECFLERFQPEVKLENFERITLHHNDIITSPDEGYYFDIERVEGSVCLEFLESASLDDTLLAWTFDKLSGVALYCESASPLPPRFRVATEIANSMGKPLEQAVLLKLAESANSLIRKEALLQLILQDRDNLISYLNRALSDPSAEISDWAYRQTVQVFKNEQLAGLI